MDLPLHAVRRLPHKQLWPRAWPGNRLVSPVKARSIWLVNLECPKNRMGLPIARGRSAGIGNNNWWKSASYWRPNRCGWNRTFMRGPWPIHVLEPAIVVAAGTVQGS